METLWVQRHRPLVLVAAVILPLLWCAVAEQLRGDLTVTTSTLVLVVIVVAAAATGDRYAGMAAAVSGGAWFDFFLTAPFRTFSIENPNDVEVAVLLVVIGFAVTELALWGRRQQAAASKRAGYLDGVLSTSVIVSGQLPTTALTSQVAASITELLDVDSCRFVPGAAATTQGPVLAPDGTVSVRGTTLDVDRDGLPTMEETAVLVRHHGQVCGAFLITAATRVMRPTREQRQVATLLAHQVADALTTGTTEPQAL